MINSIQKSLVRSFAQPATSGSAAPAAASDAQVATENSNVPPQDKVDIDTSAAASAGSEGMGQMAKVGAKVAAAAVGAVIGAVGLGLAAVFVTPMVGVVGGYEAVRNRNGDKFQAVTTGLLAGAAAVVAAPVLGPLGALTGAAAGAENGYREGDASKVVEHTAFSVKFWGGELLKEVGLGSDR